MLPAAHPVRPVVPTCALGLALLVLAGCGRPETDAARFTSVPGGDAARGRQVMSQYQCGSCHRIPDVPSADGRAGPPLEAFGQRSYIAGQVPSTPATLVRWLQDPQALVPGSRMPDMGVPETDARDMAAYLLSLR